MITVSRIARLAWCRCTRRGTLPPNPDHKLCGGKGVRVIGGCGFHTAPYEPEERAEPENEGGPSFTPGTEGRTAVIRF